MLPSVCTFTDDNNCKRTPPPAQYIKPPLDKPPGQTCKCPLDMLQFCSSPHPQDKHLLYLLTPRDRHLNDNPPGHRPDPITGHHLLSSVGVYVGIAHFDMIGARAETSMVLLPLVYHWSVNNPIGRVEAPFLFRLLSGLVYHIYNNL